MAEQKQAKKQEAVLFSDSIIKRDKGIVRKFIAFPLAFLLHASIVFAAIVIPLLNTTNLPSVEVYSAFLAPPLPLPRPPRLQLKRKRVPKEAPASNLFRQRPRSNLVS